MLSPPILTFPHKEGRDLFASPVMLYKVGRGLVRPALSPHPPCRYHSPEARSRKMVMGLPSSVVTW